MKSLHCIQCIDLYCHIIIFLNNPTNKKMVYVYSSKNYIIVYFLCIYLPRYYLYAVIVTILVVWRNFYTTMVLIPRQNSDMSIIQSFHIPHTINYDSYQYYEVFYIEKTYKIIV